MIASHTFFLKMQKTERINKKKITHLIVPSAAKPQGFAVAWMLYGF